MCGSLFITLPSLVVVGTLGGNMMVSVCHVTLQGHLIKPLNDFMVRSPSTYVTIVPSLLAISSVVVNILYSLSRDQSVMWLYDGHNHSCNRDIMGFFVTWPCKTTWSKLCMTLWKEPLKVSHHPTKFGGHRHCGKEDKMILVYHIISQDHMMERPRGLMGSIVCI